MKLLKYLCVFILLLCGCEAKPTNITKDRVQGIVAIEYDQLIEKIEADVDFLLYIGRSDCADCIEFQPILETYLENNKELGIYYLDVKAFRDAAYREDASQEEKDFFKNIYTTLEYDWTPTLQHRQGKKVISSMTYLSMEYYDIEDETEKVKYKEDNLNAIYEWLENK